MPCFEAMVQANWLWNFILGLGAVDTIARPLKIYCDNSTAVFFSKTDKYSKGAEHMELKYFAVKYFEGGGDYLPVPVKDPQIPIYL